MGLGRHLLWAGALRAVLQLLDASRWFDLFPGITNPVTDYKQIREGLWLQSNGYSPYHSPLVHTQPITLMVFGAISHLPWLTGALAIFADLLACCMINKIAGGSFHTPTTCSLLYLWSPFSILPSVATATSSFSCAMVIAAIYAATSRHGRLSAWCLALAAYLDFHSILLLVPLTLLLKNGMEDLDPKVNVIAIPTTTNPTSNSTTNPPPQGPAPTVQQDSGPNSIPPTKSTARSTAAQPTEVIAKQTTAAPTTPDHASTPTPCEPFHSTNARAQSTKPCPHPNGNAGYKGCWAFGMEFVVWAVVLLLISELRMTSFPENQCLVPWLRRLGVLSHQDPPHAGLPTLDGCWLWRSYGDVINITDLTPNIGLFWYFFMEIFTAFQGFFRLVFHSQVLALVAPFAIRFPHRPMLLTVVFLLYFALFKPYPSMSDLALYQSFLPLLHAQFRLSKVALHMAMLFAVLVVLIPAMWWQWLVVESANANFFYSVTLLLGAFHVLLQAHVLNCSVKLDRLIAGKPVSGFAIEAKSG